MNHPIEGSCDLLIAGGGITGAGIARDAAMRGLRTVLVEQNDFASGTSSRSSRLLHGGLRYLAQGHIGLVREASLEKMTICRIAPHLCEPLRFLFPVRKGGPWPRWKLAIGVRIYDLLCGKRNLGKSSSDARGVSYYDGFTNDARLVIDTLRSAQHAGASVHNYTQLVSAEPEDSGWRCQVRDRNTGAETIVRARAIANATGAWAQTLPQSSIRLRLTKGVHLVIRRERLPVDSAVVLAEGDRILFVIPWGERVILGTTDTDYDGDPAAVHADDADIAYILRIVNREFPDARLQPQEIVATFAGVRPLIAPHRVRAGAPSDVSRQHEIRMARPGWFDIAGGKLTTYRLMAEQTIDRIGHYLRMKLPASQTAEVPLLKPEETRYSGVLPPPLDADVVRHAVREEWARSVDDILLRRTSWGTYYGPQVGAQVAQWLAEIR